MVTPLEGIRVIEVANYVAGPSVGALLRDLGADVVKVEPPGGEVMRGVQVNAAVNYLFELENRGKRSVTIALDAPGGPDLLHDLLAGADVLLTNLYASRLRKYRITPEEVHARNPHIVHVSVTGYGIHGPEADRPAFDFAAFWARSGIMSLVGHPGSPPVLSRVAQGDHTTGINGVAATLAALRLRDLTGHGQVVEISLQQTGVYTIATDVARVLYDRTARPTRMDRTAALNPLFNTYPTSDGQWLMLVHMTPDPYWPRFCRVIGLDAWADDPRYATMRDRMALAPQICAEAEARFSARPFAHWARLLDEQGLIWAPMVELAEVVDDPQLRAMHAFAPVTGGLEEFETVSAPFLIRDADVGVRGRSPLPGEHTEAILAEAGIGPERIADLAEAGVFG